MKLTVYPFIFLTCILEGKNEFFCIKFKTDPLT